MSATVQIKSIPSAAQPVDTEGAPARAERRRVRVGDYLELTKPGITRLVLMTAAAGFIVGTPSMPDLPLLFHSLLGIGLGASGASALNQWWERKVDLRMQRTANRPLPSGRVGAWGALAFALTLATAGPAYLALWVNLTTAVVVALTVLSYILVYTPLKRRTVHATVVGAVPGALPVLAGWTATGQPLDAGAWALFGILFLWQIPHFLALAWIYRDDYRRGGLVMLSVGDDTGEQTARQSLVYALALLPVSLVPAMTGLLGGVYFAGTLVMGVVLIVLGARFWVQRSDRAAWRLFYGSIVYLPAVFVLMAADKLAVLL